MHYRYTLYVLCIHIVCTIGTHCMCYIYTLYALYTHCMYYIYTLYVLDIIINIECASYVR